MHVLDFLTGLQNTEVSATLLKSDYTIDVLTAISVQSVLAIAIAG